MRLKKPLHPNCPPRHLHVVPLWKLSAWWTTEFSPVYVNPTSLNKEEGRMVKDTDAGDGVSVKTPRGRQRETTSLLFPRIWLVRNMEAKNLPHGRTLTITTRDPQLRK